MSESSKSMTVGIERRPGAIIWRLGGSLTFGEGDEFRQTLESVAGEQSPLVVLDMAALDFICSMGLGAIVSLHVKSRHHEGKIRLAGPQPNVRDLFETTRLTHIFPIFPDVPSAVVG
jgi:anti-anti-sigma factor